MLIEFDITTSNCIFCMFNYKLLKSSNTKKLFIDILSLEYFRNYIILLQNFKISNVFTNLNLNLPLSNTYT